MWSNDIPTLSVKSSLNRGILAYRWLKWFSMMNSAFIVMPMPMAWEVVLSETGSIKSRFVLLCSRRETFSGNIVFSARKRCFVRTDSHSDTIKRCQKSKSICGGVKKFNNALENNCKQPIKCFCWLLQFLSFLFFFFLRQSSFVPLLITCVFSPQLPPPSRPPASPRGSVTLHSFLNKKKKRSRIRVLNHRRALTAPSASPQEKSIRSSA